MKIKRLHSNAKLPTRAYKGDLGFDLYALEDVIIPAINENGGLPVVKIRTGIAVQLHKGWGAFIKDRSSVATKLGLHVVAGVIDNGYRGEVIVAMVNLSGKTVKLEAGMKIAQLVPIPVYDDNVVEVEELEEAERGEKGFGSSDKAPKEEKYTLIFSTSIESPCGTILLDEVVEVPKRTFKLYRELYDFLRKNVIYPQENVPIPEELMSLIKLIKEDEPEIELNENSSFMEFLFVCNVIGLIPSTNRKWIKLKQVCKCRA